MSYCAFAPATEVWTDRNTSITLAELSRMPPDEQAKVRVFVRSLDDSKPVKKRITIHQVTVDMPIRVDLGDNGSVTVSEGCTFVYGNNEVPFSDLCSDSRLHALQGIIDPMRTALSHRSPEMLEVKVEGCRKPGPWFIAAGFAQVFVRTAD